MDLRVSAGAERMLLDFHRGLHEAMEALINEADQERAALILHQLDEALTELINLIGVD